MRRAAEGGPVDSMADEWIKNFSDKFREIWETGERDLDAIEEFLYAPQDSSNYEAMIGQIIYSNRRP